MFQKSEVPASICLERKKILSVLILAESYGHFNFIQVALLSPITRYTTDTVEQCDFCRLKIFTPMMLWGCLVLIPINKTDNELVSYQKNNPNFTYSAVDTISIANVHDKSKRFVTTFMMSLPFYLTLNLELFVLVQSSEHGFISDQSPQSPEIVESVEVLHEKRL